MLNVYNKLMRSNVVKCSNITQYIYQAVGQNIASIMYFISTWIPDIFFQHIEMFVEEALVIKGLSHVGHIFLFFLTDPV